jgi:hypothetical protein
MKSLALHVILGVSLLFALSHQALSQAVFGNIVGTVRDASGGPCKMQRWR